MSEKTQANPKLGKPGSGLPWPQNWFARLFAKRLAGRTPWEESERILIHRGHSIDELVKPLTSEQMLKPVLIKRIQGIEDSSRFWSVSMTLEHLVIVSTNMAEFVIQLSQGKSPDFKVDMAKVKPKNIFDAEEAKKEFNEMITKIRARLAYEVKDRTSQTTLVHPWFGPMTAHQWHWVLVYHLNIHKNQIKEILKGLEEKSS